ncbi:MAG TPA: hypothetical protein VI756_31980 [Blastocatellia bacterium]
MNETLSRAYGNNALRKEVYKITISESPKDDVDAMKSYLSKAEGRPDIGPVAREMLAAIRQPA